MKKKGGISAALTTPMDVAKTRITLAKVVTIFRDFLYNYINKNIRGCLFWAVFILKKTNNTQRGKIVRTILEIYGEKGIKG